MFGPKRNHPRLGQWDGRKRSTRADEPMLPHLWQRPVLLRVSLVLLTTVAVTLFAYLLGPPLPYRLGQIYPFDLRVRVDFEVVNQVELVNQKEIERLETNGPRPGAAKVEKPAPEKDKPPVVERYTKGMLLLERGQP